VADAGAVRSAAYDRPVESGFGGHDLATSLRSEFELLAQRDLQQRAQADRLRALANQVEERTAADEHLLEEMAAALGAVGAAAD
jgi:hypothetical protein